MVGLSFLISPWDHQTFKFLIGKDGESENGDQESCDMCSFLFVLFDLPNLQLVEGATAELSKAELSG